MDMWLIASAIRPFSPPPAPSPLSPVFAHPVKRSALAAAIATEKRSTRCLFIVDPFWARGCGWSVRMAS
ncbi:hypothetical protein ACFPRL_13650 [Pseudoclavibacter helvolus]